MDNLTRGSVKSLVTIRHLIDASIENERKQQQPNSLRVGRFKWKKNDRNFTDRKEDRTNIVQRKDDSEEEDSDEFSDALSHAEACSLAVVSDLNSSEEEGGSDCREEQESTRNFMMERFLPAASAMASKSPHQTRAPTPVRDSGQRGPLPPQSRPRLTRTASDESTQLKVACGGILSSRLKNVFGFSPSMGFSSPRKGGGRKERSFYSPRKKRVDTSVGCKDEDDESSSGTDEERAVIMATRRKAWEARYRQQKLLMKCSPLTGANSRDFNTLFQSNSPYTKSPPSAGTGSVISPFRNEAGASPFSREGKGFLGFPADRRLRNSKTIHGNEIEQEQFYSGHSSPRRSSDSSPVYPKAFYIYSDGIKSSHEFKCLGNNYSKIEEYPVSVLPPPLPKSPSESWLCRAIPRLNSSTLPMKAERQDFDDAKWEI